MYAIASRTGTPLVQKVTNDKSWLYLWEAEEDARVFMEFQKIPEDQFDIVPIVKNKIFEVKSSLDGHTLLEIKLISKINIEQLK